MLTQAERYPYADQCLGIDELFRGASDTSYQEYARID